MILTLLAVEIARPQKFSNIVSGRFRTFQVLDAICGGSTMTATEKVSS